MDVYGLTGGIGSGKSTVADLLEEYGVPVVSADELSRIVVARGSEGLADVVKVFGPEVVDDAGELDRRKMASIVFHDPDKRRELESILHPRIRERYEQVLDALEKAGHEVTVYEVPLLFEKQLQGEMKAVVLVTADIDTRIDRVRARDDVTQSEVRARIATQMDEDSKRKKADYIIENDGTLDDLRREVEFLLSRFLRVGAPRPVPFAGSPRDTIKTPPVGTPAPVRAAPSAPPVPVGAPHPIHPVVGTPDAASGPLKADSSAPKPTPSKPGPAKPALATTGLRKPALTKPAPLPMASAAPAGFPPAAPEAPTVPNEPVTGPVPTVPSRPVTAPVPTVPAAQAPKSRPRPEQDATPIRTGQTHPGTLSPVGETPIDDEPDAESESEPDPEPGT